jgi:hypothetical protein
MVRYDHAHLFPESSSFRLDFRSPVTQCRPYTFEPATRTRRICTHSFSLWVSHRDIPFSHDTLTSLVNLQAKKNVSSVAKGY